MPKPCEAWVGFELSSEAAVASDPYAPAGGRDGGSSLRVDGRFMLEARSVPADLEAHALARAERSTGRLSVEAPPTGALFRAWDLEAEAWGEGDSTLCSEFDRLSVTLRRGSVGLTLGRQAVTWGEAYYFNPADVFGAFPLLETNRLHKPGIDAAALTVSLGTFSTLEAVAVPETGQGDSAAVRWTTPLRLASLSLTAGRAAGEEVAGAGATADVRGTKLYGSLTATRRAGGGGFSQAVLGAERQLGPSSHLVLEIYRNGWGAEDPSDYPALLAEGRLASGQAPALGRRMAALAVDRQLTPLTTGTAAAFANLSDGSALLRVTVSRSLSDFADLTFGLSFGAGERPRGGEWGSEFGGAPVSLTAEAVAAF